MSHKKTEKERAVKLRQQGKTYNEILRDVPVAKSTLSLWLREVGLSKTQKQCISAKKHAAQKRGGEQRRQDRIDRTQVVISEGMKDVNRLSYRELLLVGAALYWAEGTKEKTYRPTVGLDFANSDPDMIRLHVKWLREVLNVADEDMILILHIHQNRIAEINTFTKYWLSVTGLSKGNLAKPIIKKHKPKTNRYKTDASYKGLVAIRVRRSTMLNRRVQGWIHGMIATQK
ncbi:MAG: hypothetical protein KBC35_02635 [Candidatus Pacebacteria bacterium]|nr:hypothetical protein [Candidatus Paceibacterota bacterium]